MQWSDINLPFNEVQTSILFNSTIYGVPYHYRWDKDQNNHGTDLVQFDLMHNQYKDPRQYTNKVPTAAYLSCVRFSSTQKILYVIAGMDTHDKLYHILNTTQSYDLQKDEWKYLQSMKIGVAAAGCSMTNDEQYNYTFGGALTWIFGG